MVTIKFSSAVRAATSGDRLVQIKFEGTVTQLLDQLASIYGQEFTQRIFEEGQPRQYINFYVNGEDIRYLQQFDTQITEEDTVDLIPAVAGG